MSEISFITDGDKINGHLFTAPKSTNLAFLLIQGWTGTQNIAAAQALAGLGFTSMTYDMRGNKSSEGNLGKLSRADFLKDAIIAYDFLKQQVDEQAAIGIVGSSFGGYTGILLTEQRPVACLSLRVPASYPDEGFDEPQLPQSKTSAIWRQQVRSSSENKALDALYNFQGPVQIIEAENDEVIPHQSTLNYANAVIDKSKLTHDVMRGAPHNLANEQLSAEYVGLLTKWVKNNS